MRISCATAPRSELNNRTCQQSLAGAASRLQKKMAEQQPHVPTSPAGKRRVVVAAVIHPKPNEDLMSRALLRVMEDLEDQDSDKLAS
jgi:hypothetical protein